MRIATPACLGHKWFVCIYFQEIGRAFPIVVGGKRLRIGRGREYQGQVTMVEIEVEKDKDDIHILPPAIILSVVASLTHTTLEQARRYMAKLSVERDGVELVNPSNVNIVEDMSLAKEVIRGNDQILQHLQIAEGKRKIFYGGAN